MYTIREKLSTACQIDLEITTACNHSCRYCYNFWRHDKIKDIILTKEKLDILIDQFIENKVFNVVLTGGEPFVNYNVLLHGVKRLTEAGILVSCNSNLTIATKNQLKELKEAGLPHILTSLASYDPEINDKIFNSKGSFVRVIRGIRNAVDVGIKISVNTVISSFSKDHVYKTGLLASGLGVSNLFLTRVVPSTSCSKEVATEFVLEPKKYILALDAALKVKKETGINIGSLIQYPICFLKDIEKYKDFVGRGCPAGRKMVCINANGDTHACFHEFKTYGNLFEISLKDVWNNMVEWRDNSLVPEDCKKCKWFRWCEGGCRVYADALNQKDYMCQGSDNLPDPIEDYERSMYLVNDGQFKVRNGLRFREESTFWLVHIVGAWITKVNSEVADFLKKYKKSQENFTISEFPESKESLAYLISKKIVEKV